MKVINLSGIVGYEITANGLKNKLVKNDQNYIKLDSVGGSVFEGNRLYNLLTDSLKDGYDITFELGAVAASAASYFPLAVGKEKIKVRDNTVFMGHKSWSLAIGNADDLKMEAEILDGFDKMIAKVYSKINGKSVEDNLKAMGEEFWLMGGQSVIDAGYASEIVKSSEDEDQEEQTSGKGKSEIQAMIKEAKATLKRESCEEDLEQWVAVLTEPDIENAVSPVKTPGSGIKTIQEDNMDFMSYLDQNPEHKAAFEKHRDEYAEEKAASAVTDDRERCAKIAKLYGNNESAIEAMNNGTSVGDLAVAEKEKAIEASKNAGKNADIGGLDKKKNGMPEAVEENKEKAAEEKAKASVEAYLKGAKK